MCSRLGTPTGTVPQLIARPLVSMEISLCGARAQAQKKSAPVPAAQFSLHEAEGAQDLIALVQRMALEHGDSPHANGTLGEPPNGAHEPEGASAPGLSLKPLRLRGI